MGDRPASQTPGLFSTSQSTEKRKYGGRGFIPRCAPAAAATAAAPPSLVFHPLGKNKGTNAAAHNRRNIFDARSCAREIDRGGRGIKGRSEAAALNAVERRSEVRRIAKVRRDGGGGKRKRGKEER